MINIKIKDNHVFTQQNLNLYKEVNKTKERFPEIYSNPKWEISQELVNLSDIDIPEYMDQDARDGNNPAKGEMELDINNKGFSLDGLSIVLRPEGNEYKTIDGVTKLNIFKSKDVVNAPVTIIKNISKADALKLSIKLNLKDKPYGKANLEDIKKVVKELHRIKSVKANGKTLTESIGDAITEMAGTHIPEGKIFGLIREIEEDITGIQSLLSLTPKTAKQRIEQLGYKSDRQTVYVPVGAFFEKAVTVGLNQYNKWSKYYKNDDIEIRLIVDGGVLDSEKPLDDWKKKCLNFKNQYNSYVRGISISKSIDIISESKTASGMFSGRNT